MKLKIGLILTLFITSLYADVNAGAKVYLIYCANCHSNNMESSMGKDFNIVSYNRTKDEIKRYIKYPGKVFREFGYSANAMPTLPLTKEEVRDVVDYVDSLQPFKKWMVKK